jgi:glutathione S-transferase
MVTTASGESQTTGEALTLYVDARLLSPYALSVFVTLREKGLDFELRKVDLQAGEHTQPSFRLLSLTAKVPTLLHGDFALSESSAITEYLEERFPRPTFAAVYPSSAHERARVRQVQAWLRSDLMPLRVERPTNVMFGAPVDRPLSVAANEAAQKLFFAAEHWLRNGRDGYLASQWSLADVELTVMLNRLLLNGDVVPESLTSYARRQWQRPSIQSWVGLDRSPPA